MSIADGQVVLVPGRGGAPAVDPAASISRIGGRAYPPALAALAPQLRFERAQARDAPSASMSHTYQFPLGSKQYNTVCIHGAASRCDAGLRQHNFLCTGRHGCFLLPAGAAARRAQAADALRFASDPGAPGVRRQAAFMAVAWAALAQEPGQPVPLEEQARLPLTRPAGLSERTAALLFGPRTVRCGCIARRACADAGRHRRRARSRRSYGWLTASVRFDTVAGHAVHLWCPARIA